MISLTPRQSELLRYIQDYLGENGYSPSFQEMGNALGTTSSGRISDLLTALEARGHIRRLPNRARAIEALQPAQPYIPSLRVVFGPGHFEDLARMNRDRYAREQA